MAHIVADRILESSTTTGTGNFALAGAYTGYRDFDSVMANGDTCYYCIEAIDTNGNPSGAWEVGLGTFNDTDTLVRTTPSASSNGGAAVNFAVGNKRVMLTPSAARIEAISDQDGRLIGKQVITATGAGTYTPTSGTSSIVIELAGGGGGGGGCAQPGGSAVHVGGGGGGAGYLRKRLTANFSGASYSVGAKGAGGSAGANAGAAGANSTFTDTAGSPTTYTASGGAAGPAGSAATVPYTGGRAVGGAATNGDINIPGGASLGGPALSTTSAVGGLGGVSTMSTPARGGSVNAANSSAAGNAAVGYGGGGSGAAASGTGAAVAGGDGSNGILIVWEYS